MVMMAPAVAVAPPLPPPPTPPTAPPQLGFQQQKHSEHQTILHLCVREMAEHIIGWGSYESQQRTVNQLKRKTSNVQNLTHLGHDHQAPDLEATQPMMGYKSIMLKLRLLEQ
jgi:hypothetical protein